MLKNFKNYFRFIYNLGYKNPHKHWLLILRIFSFIFIAMLVFSFYLLYKLKNEEIFKLTIKRQEKISTLNEKLLKDVTSEFDKKSQNTEMIKSQPAVYKDPSL